MALNSHKTSGGALARRIATRHALIMSGMSEEPSAMWCAAWDEGRGWIDAQLTFRKDRAR